MKTTTTKLSISLTPEELELFSAKSLPAPQYTHRQMLAATLIIEALEMVEKK